MSAATVLASALDVTAATWSACERDDATIEDVAAMLVARGELLAQLEGATTPTPAERELAGRLRILDQLLLGWCDQRRSELGRVLASLPRRAADTTVTGERLLSDFA